MSYFKFFPKLLYSLNKGQQDQKFVPNIFAKTKFVKNALQNSSLVFKYPVKDGETPEQIAFKMYDDESKHWMVLLANDVMDPQYDWVLSQRQFNEYINNKYSSYNLQLDPTETYQSFSLGQEVTISAALGQPINQPGISQVGRFKIGNGVAVNEMLDTGPGDIMTVNDPYNYYQAGMIFTYAGISGSYWPNLVNIESGENFDPGSTFATYPSICRLVELVSTGPGGIGNKWRIDKTTYLKQIAQLGDENYPTYWHLLWQRYPITIDNNTGLSIIRYSATGLPYDGIYSADGNFNRLLWNADGWNNLDQIEQRTYVSWSTLFNYASNPLTLGYYLIAKDTVTNKYYKIRFTEWNTDPPTLGSTWEDWQNGGRFGCKVQQVIPASEYITSEIAFQGSSLDSSSADCKVVSFNGDDKILQVNNLTEVLANNETITSVTSEKTHKIIGITRNDDGYEWASNTISHYQVTEKRYNSYDQIFTTDKYIISSKDYNHTNHQVFNKNTLTSYSNTYTMADSTELTITTEIAPVTYYDYEVELNEAKREINIIKSDYVGFIDSQFKTLMGK